MIVFIEIVILCVLFFILCFWGTGSDEKNLKYYDSYPVEVQREILKIETYKNQLKEKSRVSVLLGNFLLFSIILFIAGIFCRSDSFVQNFICLSLIGESINVFDLVVIDLMWWRNSERIRFRKIPEKELYRSPKKHIAAFLKGIIMFELVALFDGYLLTVFF